MKTGLSPSMAAFFQTTFQNNYTPQYQSLSHNSIRAINPEDSAWANPVSLAVTQGIIVIFFSSAY